MFQLGDVGISGGILESDGVCSNGFQGRLVEKKSVIHCQVGVASLVEAKLKIFDFCLSKCRLISFVSSLCVRVREIEGERCCAMIIGSQNPNIIDVMS